MYDFDAVKAKNECVKWIRDWFEENGKGCNAVIGISGGKDSTVVAALCAEALGPERVIGVLLPDGVQPDISDSRELIEFLRIPGVELNISAAKDAMISGLEHINFLRNYFNRLRPITTQQARENLPPRLRMSALYLAAQCWNGRVSITATCRRTGSVTVPFMEIWPGTSVPSPALLSRKLLRLGA